MATSLKGNNLVSIVRGAVLAACAAATLSISGCGSAVPIAAPILSDPARSAATPDPELCPNAQRVESVFGADEYNKQLLPVSAENIICAGSFASATLTGPQLPDGLHVILAQGASGEWVLRSAGTSGDVCASEASPYADSSDMLVPNEYAELLGCLE